MKVSFIVSVRHINVLHLSKVSSETTKGSKASRHGSVTLQLVNMLVQVQLPWLQKWMDDYSDCGGLAEQLQRPLLAEPGSGLQTPDGLSSPPPTFLFTLSIFSVTEPQVV